MNTAAAASDVSPEMEALKAKLKATWSAGDYGHFATYLEPGALDYLARLNVAPGTRMLDVACGAGQIAIPAARAGARVTGVDIAPNLVAQARARAESEGLTEDRVRFVEGDAEALPVDDGAFDLVVSLIGAMFAPRPERVAAEMARACRPGGGRVAMANWTPAGHVGQMFKVIGRHVPPPPLMASPPLWGDEATVRERFAPHGIADIRVEERTYPMRYPFPPSEVVEFFLTYYGPTNRAFASLDRAGQEALRADLVALWEANDRARDGMTTDVASEYIEVTGVRA